MKRILFVGGYANSGKSTAMKHLATSGLHCFSSSALLHKTAAALYANGWTNANVGDKRAVLIPLAEQVLVATFSRSVFVHRIYDQIAALPDNCMAAIETIGGDEFWLLYNALSNAPFEYHLECCNIRRSTEQPQADIRQLLPSAHTIDNNDTLYSLYTRLDELL
jgi:hypothetical protein